jgi:hypothetical protein
VKEHKRLATLKQLADRSTEEDEEMDGYASASIT